MSVVIRAWRHPLVRRGLSLAVFLLVFLTAGPSTLWERGRGLAASVWVGLGNALFALDLRALQQRIEQDRGRLEQAEAARRVAADQLARLRQRQLQVAARVAEDRRIVDQITALLTAQPGAVVSIDEGEFDRAVIERDGEHYRRQGQAAAAELARLNRAGRDLEAAVDEAAVALTLARQALQAREALRAAFEAGSERRRLRRELTRLETDAVEARLDQAAVLLDQASPAVHPLSWEDGVSSATLERFLGGRRGPGATSDSGPAPRKPNP